VEEFPEMLKRQKLTALVGFGLIGCVLLGGACDVWNPEFVLQNGGNPIPGSTNINGYVLLVLNNLTDGPASLTYEVDTKIVGQAELSTKSGTMNRGGTGFFAMSFQCGVQEIRLISLIAGSSTVTPDPDNPDDEEETPGVDLPTTVVRTPVLQCGTVVVVTVVGTGANMTADVQVLN
jgi:hypothetical protein